MTQRNDLDALIAGARQAPPTPPADAAARGWSRLSGQLGAVVVAPQIDLPPGLVESAAAGKATGIAGLAQGVAHWGWFGKAVASAAVTVTLGGAGIAAVGPFREAPAAVVSTAVPSTVAPTEREVPQAEVRAPAELPSVEPVAVVAATPIEATPIATTPIATTPIAATPVTPAALSAASTPTPRPVTGGIDVEAPLISAALRKLSAGDADGALVELATHRRRFPRGVMVEDREALRISALCGAGRQDAAATLRTEFLRRWPSSPHAPRVRDACSTGGD